MQALLLYATIFTATTSMMLGVMFFGGGLAFTIVEGLTVRRGVSMGFGALSFALCATLWARPDAFERLAGLQRDTNHHEVKTHG